MVSVLAQGVPALLISDLTSGLPCFIPCLQADYPAHTPRRQPPSVSLVKRFRMSLFLLLPKIIRTLPQGEYFIHPSFRAPLCAKHCVDLG